MSSNQMKLLLAAASAAVPFVLHGCKGDDATTSNVADGCLEIQCAGKSFECDDKGSCKYKGDTNAKVEDVCKYEVTRHGSSAWIVNPTKVALEGTEALPEIEKLYVKGNCIFAVGTKDAKVTALTVEQNMLIGYAGDGKIPAKTLTVKTGEVNDKKFWAYSQAALTMGDDQNSNFKVTGNFSPPNGPTILHISTDGKQLLAEGARMEYPDGQMCIKKTTEAAPADAKTLYDLATQTSGTSASPPDASAAATAGKPKPGQQQLIPGAQPNPNA